MNRQQHFSMKQPKESKTVMFHMCFYVLFVNVATEQPSKTVVCNRMRAECMDWQPFLV